ncbi:MAG: PIG-L deacetylase family protein [Planctomycetota bacterium]|jgi:LmbE family N-acetylglucosaminyl deacetylase
MRSKKTILIVAAHPDDEVLGCGGSAAKLVSNGDEVYTLILGQGIASRYENGDEEKIKGEIEELRTHVYAANKIIGVKEVFIHDFPDNKFDSVPLLDLIKVVEQKKAKVKPDIIFTHYSGDLNIDHQLTYKAVMTAVRPLPNETVREIYSFEVLSSTGLAYPTPFSPDVFFDISETIDLKLEAMSTYKSELREFPHPRSLKGIKLNAKYWGMTVGLKYCEAFKNIRVVKK